jgi:4-amino-4-deoxy-L-arabinose transferase-like glycosyltransferase
MTNTSLAAPQLLRAPADPQQAPARTWAHLAVIVLVWAIIYVPGLFSPALLDDADSFHAETAREMVLRGDWVTLYVNGFRYLEKAPVMYWGMATSFTLFGPAEWTARLPLTLGMLGLMLALYGLGRRVYGARAGLYAAVIVATGFGPYIYTRILIPDVIVGLLLTLSFGLFLRSLEEDPPSRLTCWGFAVVCAANVLTKGLIGLVFPFGAIAIYLLLTRNLGHLLRLRLLSSTLVFFLVAAPWHVLAALRNPAAGEAKGFLWFYFVNEHFLRFLNKRIPPGYDTVPLVVFWGLVLVWLFPWTVFLPQALAQVPHTVGRFAAGFDRRGRASLLFALWAAVIVVFFSFSTSQEYYTIPAMPALALLIAAWLARESRPTELGARRAGRISSFVLLAVGVAAFVVAMLLLREAQAPAPGADLAQLLKPNPEMYDLSMGHLFDLTPQALGIFRDLLLVTAIALLAGTGLNLVLRLRERPHSGNIALIGMMVVVLLCVHVAYARFNPVLSSRDLARAIQRVHQPGDIIVVDGEYSRASTLNFYTQQQLRVLNGRAGVLWYGSHFPDAPEIFEDNASFLRLWNGGTRVFFWTQEEDPKVLAGRPVHKLAYGGGKYILTNRPVAMAAQ